MRRLLVFLFLGMIAAPGTPQAAAKERAVLSQAVTRGGLSCFTITPPAAPAEPPTSCNDLCAQEEAVCTGVTSAWNPPQSCEDNAQQGRQTCRCCQNGGRK